MSSGLYKRVDKSSGLLDYQLDFIVRNNLNVDEDKSQSREPRISQQIGES